MADAPVPPVRTGSRTSKAKAGAFAAATIVPVLLTINDIIPDAPWPVRAGIFALVAAIYAGGVVYWAPRNADEPAAE